MLYIIFVILLTHAHLIFVMIILIFVNNLIILSHDEYYLMIANTYEVVNLLFYLYFLTIIHNNYAYLIHDYLIISVAAIEVVSCQFNVNEVCFIEHCIVSLI